MRSPEKWCAGRQRISATVDERRFSATGSAAARGRPGSRSKHGWRGPAATRSSSLTRRSSRSSYAALWNEPLRGDREAYEASVQRWLHYYEQEGNAAIGIGAVVLRRREGENRCRGFDLERPATGHAGPQLVRLFNAMDAPAVDDDSFLEGRYRLVDGHNLDQSLRFENGRYGVQGVRVTLDDGVGLTATVDAAILSLLFALDPSRKLRSALSEAEISANAAVPAMRVLFSEASSSCFDCVGTDRTLLLIAPSKPVRCG